MFSNKTDFVESAPEEITSCELEAGELEAIAGGRKIVSGVSFDELGILRGLTPYTPPEVTKSLGAWLKE